MKILKKRMVYMCLIFVIGFIMTAYSFIMKTEVTMSSMGIGFMAVSIVRAFQYYKLYKNPKRMEQFEIANSEERVVFIASKARSLMWALTIYAAIIAMIVCMFKGMSTVATIIGLAAAAESLGYLICYKYFDGKY